MNPLKSFVAWAKAKLFRAYQTSASSIRKVYLAKNTKNKQPGKIKYQPIEDFDYSKYPRKLNLGCGFDLRLGYLNVDFQEFHHPDLVADIRKLEMLPSGFYEEVLAQDCLEHFPRCDTKPTLAEWSRLLKPGGVLKLRVPNLLGLFELFTWESKQTIDDQETLVQCLFGTQAYDGDWHLTGFTQVLLERYLQDTGFDHLKFESKDYWLFEIVCSKKG